jgi:uncharacterized protein (TIGR01777 family)
LFIKQGHKVIIRTRNVTLLRPSVRGINQLQDLDVDEIIDVAINLAGEPIADKRWSHQQKNLILNSRLSITQEFIDYFKKATHKPKVFISSSAIGYYGIKVSEDGINEPISESSNGDASFSSELCQQWESLALQSDTLGIRTCLLRTGIVLGKDGGALNKMLPIFKLGIGGKIGSGKQWMPWIHISDMITVVDYCIANTSINGAINCTAPNPVTNREFTKDLAHTLKRPAILNIPEWLITLVLGQMGKELLLCGKKVMTSKLKSLGFTFEYERLAPALIEILADKE